MRMRIRCSLDSVLHTIESHDNEIYTMMVICIQILPIVSSCGIYNLGPNNYYKLSIFLLSLLLSSTGFRGSCVQKKKWRVKATVIFINCDQCIKKCWLFVFSYDHWGATEIRLISRLDKPDSFLSYCLIFISHYELSGFLASLFPSLKIIYCVGALCLRETMIIIPRKFLNVLIWIKML